MKDFLSLEQLNMHQIRILTDLNSEMKAIALAGRKRALHLLGKTVLCVSDTEYDFVPMQLACRFLGGDAVTASTNDIIEYAKSANNYGVNMLAVKTKSYAIMNKLAEISAVPVINLGTDTRSPIEALSYIFTLAFTSDTLEGKNVAILGNKNSSVAAELTAYLRQSRANVFPYFPFANSSFYPQDIAVFTKIEYALRDADYIIDLGLKNKADNELYYGDACGLSEALLTSAKPSVQLLGSRTVYTREGEAKEYLYNHYNRQQKDFLGACMSVLYYFYRD